MQGYRKLHESGKLESRARELAALAAECRLCPWSCGARRLRGATGRCRAGALPRVARAVAHFGEEPPLTGTAGSGTIFFSHCNLRCCFCQNWQISHEGLGTDITVERLAETMCALQLQGCHNINLVSAAQYMPWVVQALALAAAAGLSIPLVYNSNGYESPELLGLLDGIIDIYLPDAKYATAESAERYSGAKDYAEVNAAALREMFRQAGYLETDERGVARRGLLVRHLVLPGGRADTALVLRHLRREFGRFLSVSLMGQYRPCYRACETPGLEAPTSAEEYAEAVGLLEELGFETAFTQQAGELDGSFVPDFRKKDSWN